MLHILLAGMTTAEARKPQVGDCVVITFNNDLAPQSYGGKIADLSNGFVCQSAVSVNIGSNSLFDSMGEVHTIYA